MNPEYEEFEYSSIEDAICEYNMKNSKQNGENLILSILCAMYDMERLIVPIDVDSDTENLLINVSPMIVKDRGVYLTAFTTWDQWERKNPGPFVFESIEDYLQTALDIPESAGIILNPYGKMERFRLSKRVIKAIFSKWETYSGRTCE